MAVFKGIVAGIVGGSAFLLFYLGLDKGLPLSLLMMGVSVGATLLITQLFSTEKKEGSIQFGSEEYYRNEIEEGYKKVIVIRNEIGKFKDVRMQEIGKNIVKTLEDIFAELRKKPEDVTLVRELFSTYLNAALKNIEKYNEISFHSLKEEMKKQTDTQMIETLHLLDKYFAFILHNNLLQDDCMELEVKAKTLKKMLEMEGIES